MKVISITGGVGSGKSEVMKILKEDFGAEIIMADQVAHQLMEPGKKGYHKVVEAMGTSFLKPDGSIDRKELAALMFKDQESVKRINGLIHPMVWKEIQYAVEHSDKNLAVVEAALFDEEHNALFDEIWYVYATVENRLNRLMANRGYTKEKCMEIMANQASEETFRRLADFIIENNGAVEEIRFQIKKRLEEV